MHVVLFVECWLVASSSIYYQIFLASYVLLPLLNAIPLPFYRTFTFFTYSAGAGDGALTTIGADTSTLSGSGDSVRNSPACGRGQGSNDSGGRTPPRRRRGVARGLLRTSVGGGGGSDKSALLGSQERNVRWSRGTSVCCCCCAGAGTGAGGTGLDRVLSIAPAPVSVLDRVFGIAPTPVSVLDRVLGIAPTPVSVLVLSGRGLQGRSGWRDDGKKRRGGMPIAFKGGNDDVVVCAAESSVSASTGAALLLLPSRLDDRRREVKSVKSTVRDRAGTRRMDGWRVRGGADGAADAGGGGPHASGEASRRVPQLSRRVERST